MNLVKGRGYRRGIPVLPMGSSVVVLLVLAAANLTEGMLVAADFFLLDYWDPSVWGLERWPPRKVNISWVCFGSKIESYFPGSSSVPQNVVVPMLTPIFQNYGYGIAGHYHAVFGRSPLYVCVWV